MALVPRAALPFSLSALSHPTPRHNGGHHLGDEGGRMLQNDASPSHMGADFFLEGGKNASINEVPLKMALGEGILFLHLGEG